MAQTEVIEATLVSVLIFVGKTTMKTSRAMCGVDWRIVTTPKTVRMMVRILRDQEVFGAVLHRVVATKTKVATEPPPTIALATFGVVLPVITTTTNGEWRTLTVGTIDRVPCGVVSPIGLTTNLDLWSRREPGICATASTGSERVRVPAAVGVGTLRIDDHFHFRHLENLTGFEY
jgi:hypothetical protein